jgi:hypothetical protein
MTMAKFRWSHLQVFYIFTGVLHIYLQYFVLFFLTKDKLGLLQFYV